MIEEKIAQFERLTDEQPIFNRATNHVTAANDNDALRLWNQLLMAFPTEKDSVQALITFFTDQMTRTSTQSDHRSICRDKVLLLVKSLNQDQPSFDRLEGRRL